MSFIQKNPLNTPKIETTPPSPMPGTRGLFAKEDGWYDINSDGTVKKLSDAGLLVESGGEVFNDYEKNQALSSKSHAEGTYNVAGSMSFSITAYDPETKTFTLDSVEGLTAFKAGENGGKDTPGDTYSCQMSYNYDVYGQIVSIDEEAKTVVVDIAPEEVIDNNGKNVTQASIADGKAYFYIPGKPNLGTKPWGTGAHAEGYGTYAVSVGAHSEGYNNISAGKYSHTEGRDNIASYAAHAEGNNNKSIGQQSHTEGHGNTATAINSHAEGLNTYANGDNSHTEGSGTITHQTAYNSHAEGSGSQVKANAGHAEGDGCIVHENAEGGHAEGKITNAHGIASHSEGQETITYGTGSHAEGCKSGAHANVSHAEGFETNAYGAYSHTEGWGTETTEDGFAGHVEGGHCKVSAEAGHAEGKYCEVQGTFSHAEGWGTKAIGTATHTEGYSTDKNAYFAKGNYSHTEGYNTTTNANAVAAHAEGWGTVVNFKGCHSEGIFTKANGEASHVEGRNTYTQGIAAHAEGGYNTANGDYSHVEGLCNTLHGTDPTHPVRGMCTHVEGKAAELDLEGKYVHVVGWGEVGTNKDGDLIATTRKNIHTISIEDGHVGDAWFAGEVTIGSNKKKLATESYVDDKVADLVNSAPGTLDTLNELAEALGNDPEFATTVAREIGNKVDKVDGKGLSSNDYTDADMQKLAGVETGAQVNSIISVNGKQGEVVLNKEDIGLDKIDNTSDAEKPLSDEAKARFEEIEESIPTTTSQLTNNSGFIASDDVDDKIVAHNIANDAHDDIRKSITGVSDKLDALKTSEITNNSGYITSGEVGSVVSAHNADLESHDDIRDAVAKINETLVNFLNTDNTTLDQMNEVVAYITKNRTLIEGVTTNKINVSDIADNVTSNASNKVLSAKQGFLLNSYVQNISNQLTTFLGIDETTRGKVASLIEYADTNKNLLVGMLTSSNGEIFNDYANNQATGAYSHAEGYKTSATGFAAHAEGNNNSTARGNYSHAEGNGTISHGEGSHSEGYETYSESEYSHAEGYKTKSGGKYSHMEGCYTGGTGFAAHAEGGGDSETDRSAANGDYSHVEGLGCKVTGLDATNIEGTSLRGFCQHVQGKYNLIDWGDFNNKGMSRYAHIVGNGTDNNHRSNAHTLDWAGNAWYSGTVEATGIILKSSTPDSTKRFIVTVDDSGSLSVTEIVAGVGE